MRLLFLPAVLAAAGLVSPAAGQQPAPKRPIPAACKCSPQCDCGQCYCDFWVGGKPAAKAEASPKPIGSAPSADHEWRPMPGFPGGYGWGLKGFKNDPPPGRPSGPLFLPVPAVAPQVMPGPVTGSCPGGACYPQQPARGLFFCR